MDSTDDSHRDSPINRCIDWFGSDEYDSDDSNGSDKACYHTAVEFQVESESESETPIKSPINLEELCSAFFRGSVGSPFRRPETNHLPGDEEQWRTTRYGFGATDSIPVAYVEPIAEQTSESLRHNFETEMDSLDNEETQILEVNPSIASTSLAPLPIEISKTTKALNSKEIPSKTSKSIPKPDPKSKTTSLKSESKPLSKVSTTLKSTVSTATTKSISAPITKTTISVKPIASRVGSASSTLTTRTTAARKVTTTTVGSSATGAVPKQSTATRLTSSRMTTSSSASSGAPKKPRLGRHLLLGPIIPRVPTTNGRTTTSALRTASATTSGQPLTNRIASTKPTVTSSIAGKPIASRKPSQSSTNGSAKSCPSSKITTVHRVDSHIEKMIQSLERERNVLRAKPSNLSTIIESERSVSTPDSEGDPNTPNTMERAFILSGSIDLDSEGDPITPNTMERAFILSDLDSSPDVCANN